MGEYSLMVDRPVIRPDNTASRCHRCHNCQPLRCHQAVTNCTPLAVTSASDTPPPPPPDHWLLSSITRCQHRPTANYVYNLPILPGLIGTACSALHPTDCCRVWCTHCSVSREHTRGHVSMAGTTGRCRKLRLNLGDSFHVWDVVRWPTFFP